MTINFDLSPGVVVEEVHSGDWGIAGNPLSTADVKALAAGATVG